MLSEEISSQSNGLFSSVAFCVSLVDVTFHCLQITKENVMINTICFVVCDVEKLV